MYRSLKLKNFKSFSDYSISLKEMNVLVGPNNAGKSSVLDAFRALSGALKLAYRRNPTEIVSGGEAVWGYSIPASAIPIPLNNIHTDYNEQETCLLFTHENGNRLKLVLSANDQCQLIPDKFSSPIRNTKHFRAAFPNEVACFPTLGPLEEEEGVLSEDYVLQWMQTRRSHRMFRNIWFYNQKKFDEFRAIVSATWPSMSIELPRVGKTRPPRVDMFCKEAGKYRELSWAGFGFQVWLQILTHLLFAPQNAILIVDEPEIYLHPDLQHRLFEMLRKTDRQVILATHSVEIINAAEYEELTLIDSRKKTAHRVDDVEGMQNALNAIGSTQNIYLAKLSRGKKVLFFEGQDFKLIKKIAKKLNFSSLAEDISTTVIPIGGFSQNEKIENAAWTFETILQTEIKIAALLDRDYRCKEEIETLVKKTKDKVSQFYILDAKEIENYLLVPAAIARALNDKLSGVRTNNKNKMIDEEGINQMLYDICEELKSEVMGQLIAHKIRSVTKEQPKHDVGSISAAAVKDFEEIWKDHVQKLKVVPGKQVLAKLNTIFQTKFGTSITTTQIVNHLEKKTIDLELLHILNGLNSFSAA